MKHDPVVIVCAVLACAFALAAAYALFVTLSDDPPQPTTPWVYDSLFCR
jgi:hypothetical protein